MKLMLKIGKVDMDGYLGRDNHPAETDSGLTGEIINMTIIPEDFLLDEIVETKVFVVKLDDRYVEIVEHEVEKIWTEE